MKKKRVTTIILLVSLLLILGVVGTNKWNEKHGVLVYSTENIPDYWKENDSKQTVFAFKEWNQSKGMNPGIEIKEDGLNSDLSGLNSLERKKKTQELFSEYLYDFNTFIGDNEDKLLTQEQINELKASTLFWADGKKKEIDVLKRWKDISNRLYSDTGVELDEPTAYHESIKMKDNAFDQLTALEDGLISKLSTSSPSFYVIEVRQNNEEHYDVFYIGTTLKSESGEGDEQR